MSYKLPGYVPLSQLIPGNNPQGLFNFDLSKSQVSPQAIDYTSLMPKAPLRSMQLDPLAPNGYNPPVNDMATLFPNELRQANPNLNAINGLETSTAGGTGAFGTGLPWFTTIDPKTQTKQLGLADYGLSGLQTLGGLYFGMKNLGLAQDQLDFSKDSFFKNWEAQKATTNAELSDRQARRVQENSGATSVADYMSKYGIK